MLKLSIFKVDAFASRLFGGNPAAVIPLDSWLPDSMLQSIAAENNLPATAFFVKNQDDYDLRWFTPRCEVDLCGHATLAAAYVLFKLLGHSGSSVEFVSKSGKLWVEREGDLITLNFPACPPMPIAADYVVMSAMGGNPSEILAARALVLIYGSETEVVALRPDFQVLANQSFSAFIATAPGNTCDFVSRFFAPAKGIPEDSVTGSAHTTLIPLWTVKLGKSEMLARQVSARGGELRCALRGERVKISGYVTPYLSGTIWVPE